MLLLVEITAFRLESKSCKEFSLQINFPPMRALKFIRGYVIIKLRYDQIYQMKTTKVVIQVSNKPILQFLDRNSTNGTTQLAIAYCSHCKKGTRKLEKSQPFY